MESCKRVLEVFHIMNRGGAETLIMNLYRNIDRSRIQMDFVVHSKEPGIYDDEIKRLGGKIYYCPSYEVKNHFQYKKWWENFFAQHSEYTIVHGHATGPAAVYLKVANKYHCVTIAHSHIAGSQKGFKQYVINLYQKPLKNIAKYKFACSRDAGEWLFGKKTDFIVFNNAIDSRKFIYSEKQRKKMRNELGIKDSTFVIGNVARFHLQKNHTFLIDIFKEILDKNPDSCLVLVGDGELRSEIEDKVSKLGITEHVVFTGVRTDINNLMQAFDYFLFPSLYEGLGIVLIEAQASGLPCMTSAKVVPIEAKVTDQLVYFSLDKTAKGWATEVLNHANEHVRQDRYQDILDKKYDINQIAKWLENFYLEVKFE